LSPERQSAPATTFTPPEIFGVDLYEQVGLPYNPDRARSLLAQAGYPDGSGLPGITLWYNEVEGDKHRPLAEAAQEQWREVLGVEVNLRSKPWDEYLAMINSAPPQIWRLGWGADYVDPHNFLHDAICSKQDADFYNDQAASQADLIEYAPDEATRRDRITEFSEGACKQFSPTRFLWDNSEYNALVQTALQELDEQARRDLYIRAERILCETDAVVIPIYHYHVDYE
jgi:oligopeptide transport system substrate-binding protein